MTDREVDQLQQEIVRIRALFLLVASEGVILDSIPHDLHSKMLAMLTPHGAFVPTDIVAARACTDQTDARVYRYKAIDREIEP